MVELLPSELRALALLSEGWTYADIATVMSCGPSVVKNTLVSVRTKLGAMNAPHAVAIALREKLIA